MTEILTTKGKLIGKLLIDWCNQKQADNIHIHFNEALCSGLQNIRFVSDNINSVFPKNEHPDGYILCYEILNIGERVDFTLKLRKNHIEKKQFKTYLSLLSALNIADCDDNEIVLRKWNVAEAETNISQISEILNQLYNYEISYFESELSSWLNNHRYKIKSFPKFDSEQISITQLPDDILIEGAMKDILSNKYERNPKARNRCIAHYGTACMICGFDFGEIYGEEFAGKIHVHHRKPLNEIGEDYVVDPIKDLVPVCPNCHLMLHSKKDGVYTVDEIRGKLRKCN